MFKSRVLIMAMQLITVVLIYQFSNIDSGFFLLSTQFIQVFVVASHTFFIGINIKSEISNKKSTYNNYSWLLIISLIIGTLMTLMLLTSIHFYSNHEKTLSIVMTLSLGILPLCVYSVNCGVLESTNNEKYMIKVNLCSILVEVVSLIFLYLITHNLIFSIALSISITRMYMAIHSSIPLIKYLCLKRLNLNYIKDILCIGLYESITSASLVILMSVLIKHVSTLFYNNELSKFSVYMGIMNFLFVTGFSAVISLATNYNKDENFFLKTSARSNLFYFSYLHRPLQLLVLLSLVRSKKYQFS